VVGVPAAVVAGTALGGLGAPAVHAARRAAAITGAPRPTNPTTRQLTGEDIAVPVAITSTNDLSRWARGNGLEILLLVIGAVLIGRLINWISHRLTVRIDASAARGDALVQSEDAKHRHAVIQVVTWTALALLAFVTALLVLERFGIPLTSLVAPATVVGVAVGFGAQRVVQDLLAGLFIISERQYGFGDVIRISAIGATTGVTGTVEDVTLRVTRLRTLNGEVVFIPNGAIQQVTNQSRDWARAVVDVPVPSTADVGHVTDVLHGVCQAAFDDPELHPLLLDPPSVMGVESLDVNTFSVRVVARTLPGKQFDVGRQLRARIAKALTEAGLTAASGLEAPPPTAGG
jgi:moderate conductance mechanosensitive channel